MQEFPTDAVDSVRLVGNEGAGTNLFVLRRKNLTIGRSSALDIVLGNPDVSRWHAEIFRRGDAVYIRDLGSTAGTRVNGARASGPVRLQDGDVIDLASARLEYRHRSRGDVGPPVSAPPAAGSPGRFDLGEQTAGTIHNVAGNQHNVTHILQQRDSLLRDVATSKTKARWIIVAGFTLECAGFGLFAAGVLRFLLILFDELEQIDSFSSPFDGGATPFGFEILGIPSGLLGWATAGVGAILLVIGITLHIVASARGRRVERDLPLPAGGGRRADA